MWHLSVPWWELVLRGVVVYAFLILLLRVTGKRQVGQLAPFDLVLLLVLANAVQNSMNAGDNSLLGGLIIATTLIGLNYAVGLATFKSKQLEAVIEGRPQVLIQPRARRRRSGRRRCPFGEQLGRVGRLHRAAVEDADLLRDRLAERAWSAGRG
jgi:hypothetical protein